jgi:hypothetical protein
MKKNLLKLLTISILFISNNKIFSQAKGFSVTTTKCNALTLGWTSSKAVIIVAKESGLPDFIPANNNAYSASPYFNLKGNSAPTFGTNCYIVYNKAGTNYATIDSLKPCTNYYFTIYEHDNKGASTKYDTASARIKVTTYCLKLSFDIVWKDSCEAHNLFEFKNTSTSTIPGIYYFWDFGDGKTDTGKAVTHIYNNTSGKIPVNLKSLNSQNCDNYKQDYIRIYTKKVSKLDTSKMINPQCLNGNYFEVDLTPIASPLSKSLTYRWNFGDGNMSVFKKMKQSYEKAGTFYVEVVIRTNVNQKPTSCTDTLRFVAYVRPVPDAKVEMKDTVQCLNGHSFAFQSKRFKKTANKWLFGDGTFDTTINTQYTYSGANTYNAAHTLIDSNGCVDTFYFKLRTLGNTNSSFSGLDTAYCVKDTSIKLTTTSPYGNFYGYPVKNNFLKTDSVGNYQLKYAIRLKNCSDSTTKTFKIKSSCFPSLGSNLIISAGQNITLDAGAADFYLWNTGATTQTILVEGSKLTAGSNIFIVKASNKNGCFGIDTIVVGLDYFSKISEIKQTAFHIYPNPVSNCLNFSTSTLASFDWTVYNMEGKLLISGNENAIDFSTFEKGLYLIEFISGNLKETYKISKD